MIAMPNVRIPVWLIVVAAFAAFIGLNLFGAYVISLYPSPEEACARDCKVVGKRGAMVYVYREELTRGMRGKGPMECRCT